MRTLKYITFQLLLLLVCGCGSTLKLDSQSPATKVIADGEITEWQSNLNYIEDKDVSVGYYNDEEFLYIALKTTDRTIIRQILGRGLNVWLDGNGGSSKKFGINFPMGGGMMGMRGERPEDMERGERPDRRRHSERSAPPDFEEMEKRMMQELTIYELTTPKEKEKRLFNTDEVDGIRMKIKMSRDEGMVYELQVPLNSSEQYPYGIELGDNKTIGVGFETAKFEMETMPSGSGMSGRPGGIGGGMGGMRGDRGGMGGPGMGGMNMSSQFKLWTKVTLSGHRP